MVAPRLGFDNLARRWEMPARAYAGSTGVNTPADRLLSDDLAECWRSAEGVFATWIEIHLPAVELIDTVVLAATNLTGQAQGRVRIGQGDLALPGNVAHDTGQGPAGVVDPWGLACWFLAEPVPGDRVRIDLDDPALAGLASAIEAPRVWLTRAWRPQRSYQFGWQRRFTDYSTVTRASSGAAWVTERAIARGYQLSFGVMPEVDADQAAELQRLCGSSRELLLCTDTSRAGAGARTVVARPVGQPITHEHPQLWSWTLDCEEVL